MGRVHPGVRVIGPFLILFVLQVCRVHPGVGVGCCQWFYWWVGYTLVLVLHMSTVL